ncbi:MAG: hypothetical protein COA78_08490 [Blastopirellula sp.]|nr:MAG: hypothetical protein COA78_08490 [Blastopirellula sp.]
MNFRQPQDTSDSSKTNSASRKLVSAMPRVLLRIPSLVVPISIDEPESPASAEQASESISTDEVISRPVEETTSYAVIDLSVNSEEEPKEESLLLPPSDVVQEPPVSKSWDQRTSSLNQPATEQENTETKVETRKTTEVVAVSATAIPRQKLEADQKRKERLRQVQGNQWRNGFFLTGVAASLLWMTYLVINGNPFSEAIDSLYTSVEEEQIELDIDTGELAVAPQWTTPVEIPITRPTNLAMIPTIYASGPSIGSPNISLPLTPGNFQQANDFKAEVDIVGPLLEELAPPLAASVQTENHEPNMNHDHFTGPQIAGPQINQSSNLPIRTPQIIENVDTRQSGHWMKNDPRSTATRVSLARRETRTAETPQFNGQWDSSSVPNTNQGYSQQNVTINPTNSSYSSEAQGTYSSYPVTPENRVNNPVPSSRGPSYFAPLQPNHDDRNVPFQANLYGNQLPAPRTR